MVRLRQLGERLPQGAVLLSPWANLSDAAVAGPHRDLWLSREHLRTWARHYVGGADARDPLISPAYADLSGLAPLLVLVGEDEALAEETRRAGRAGACQRDRGPAAGRARACSTTGR